MNSYRRQRETSAPITEWNGFSVVAPISVTRPDSTTGRSASCWALLKRWISSMKSTVRCPCEPSRSRARPITACTSALPDETAESSSKTDCVLAATMRASVVLPVPGRPEEERGADAVLLDRAPQGGALADELGLAGELVERLRAQAVGERRMRCASHLRRVVEQAHGRTVALE